MKPKIQLCDGSYLDFSHIEQCIFDIEVIAHALSNTCRFSGHTEKFYSVAQHSAIVSALVNKNSLRKAALLHDASEAFMSDIAAPLKTLLPDYKRIEHDLQHEIERAYELTDLSYNDRFEIRKADLIALTTEQRDLMKSQDDWEGCEGHQPIEMTIEPMTPQEAFSVFMLMWNVYKRW